MNKKIEKLCQWGCDVNSTMERMLDDEEFYIECLGTIPEDKNFIMLEEALQKKDIPAAFDYAHALKGVLINLGLTPMYNKTVEIVEPLRQGRDDDLQERLSELKRMKDYLQEILVAP